MGAQIDWTETALADLQSLVEYIASDNAAAAEKLGNQIVDAVERLAHFPRLGRVVPEKRSANIRELIVRPCRIVYQVSKKRDLIMIVRVWHASRGEPDLR